MAFMYTDLGGEIRIGNYTPGKASPLARGAEAALLAAAKALCEREDGRFHIPGMRDLPSGADGYFARTQAISEFRARLEEHMAGGA